MKQKENTYENEIFKLKCAINYIEYKQNTIDKTALVLVVLRKAHKIIAIVNIEM